ncbi:MAG: histone deacetylase [Planctomycetaceae bacterium]
MKYFYTDHFELPLPDTHTFPMSKYRLLRERILSSDQIPSEHLCVPDGATDEQLRRVHTAAYIQRVKAGTLATEEVRRIGFPWSELMVERSRRSVGATIAAAHTALGSGYGVNLAGGTHHAFADAGAGYCVFNDVAVAVRELQTMKLVSTVAIIDCDAHQGDGNAVLFESDPSVFTFSMHARKAFPARKKVSDLDVALDEGVADEEYLEKLLNSLQTIAVTISPDIVFYVAGADPFMNDRLGRLSLTKDGLARRDQMVFDWCSDQGAAVATVMAGGYSKYIPDIVDVHFRTVLEAWSRWSAVAS